MHPVTLLPGDTTGPDLTRATQRVLDTLGVAIAWDEQPIADDEVHDTLLASATRTKCVLMAYHHGRRDEGRTPPVVALRKKLGTFANIRPVHTIPGLPSRYEGVDLVVVRETTEDIYAHLEHESIPGVFESLKVTTRPACGRIARFAYEYARAHGRRRVTIVHKANIMKRSDGMFLQTAKMIAEEYPDLEVDDVIVDALCMKLMLHPERFDVLLCGNLFGDIVADVAAGIAGGRSNCPSVNLNAEGVHVFGSPHGDPPFLVGSDRGDPLTLLFPTVLMLRHLGETEAADRLMQATERTLTDGFVPVAAGGDCTAAAFFEHLHERL